MSQFPFPLGRLKVLWISSSWLILPPHTSLGASRARRIGRVAQIDHRRVSVARTGGAANLGRESDQSCPYVGRTDVRGWWARGPVRTTH